MQCDSTEDDRELTTTPLNVMVAELEPNIGKTNDRISEIDLPSIW